MTKHVLGLIAGIVGVSFLGGTASPTHRRFPRRKPQFTLCKECDRIVHNHEAWWHAKECSWFGPKPDGRIECKECGEKIPPRAHWYHKPSCSKYEPCPVYP